MKTLAVRLARLASVLAIVAGLLAAAGCGDASCKNACDKLDSCNLGSSGFSCDSNCRAPDDSCAVCVNAKSCSDIASGACSGDCTKATFSKK